MVSRWLWHEVRRPGNAAYRHWKRRCLWLVSCHNSKLKKDTMNTTTEIAMTREQILAASLDARVKEVMHYQINIDNYSIALQEIGRLPSDERNELAKFAEQLRGLLASERLEQKKAKIMLSVIKQQVE
jgi:hypothetical protein